MWSQMNLNVKIEIQKQKFRVLGLGLGLAIRAFHIFDSNIGFRPASVAWTPRSDVSFNLPDPKPPRIVPMGRGIDEYDLKENISDKKLWCLVIFQSLEKKPTTAKTHTWSFSV